MPKANVASVTASAPKTPNRQLIFSTLCGLLAGLLVLGIVAWRHNASCPIKLEQGCLQLEYARTAPERALGLGNRDSLAANSGMLFILPYNDQACFWMKDMRFNLDIVWLSPAKKITMIEPNLSPSTYPDTYCPARSAGYVLEFNAGVAMRNNLQIGQQLNF